jgi:desulfoferrodoxin (superoxide reductase-like protein)
MNQELIHLNPSPSELQTAFIHWKIILNFIEQRDNIHQSDFNKEEKPEWFLTLKKNNADIVFYKRAEIYEPLHPFKEP